MCMAPAGIIIDHPRPTAKAVDRPPVNGFLFLDPSGAVRGPRKIPFAEATVGKARIQHPPGENVRMPFGPTTNIQPLFFLLEIFYILKFPFLYPALPNMMKACCHPKEE